MKIFDKHGLKIVIIIVFIIIFIMGLYFISLKCIEENYEQEKCLFYKHQPIVVARYNEDLNWINVRQFV